MMATYSTSFIITELNGELVRSERRRELETVLTSVLLGEKLHPCLL